MKIDGKITMLFDDEGMRLEIYDDEARLRIVKITLNNKQVCQMLSRLSNVNCENTEVFGLDKIGKKHTNKSFDFPMPEHEWSNRIKVALKEIKKVCPKRWESDDYFGSRDSFFLKNGKEYARVTIRKWE